MHTIVVDLGYGDAGKGTVVDWLASPAMGGEPVGAVVRFNGGAQAGHNVITPTAAITRSPSSARARFTACPPT